MFGHLPWSDPILGPHHGNRIGLGRQRARLRRHSLSRLCQRDTVPLGRNLRQPAKREAAKAAYLFALSKHRLDDRLALLVHSLPGRRLQLLPHLADHARVSRGRCRARPGRCATVLLPVRGHVEIHGAQRAGGELSRVGVARFRRDLLGQPSTVRLDLLQSAD